jgi:hypothetical protein
MARLLSCRPDATQPALAVGQGGERGHVDDGEGIHLRIVVTEADAIEKDQ